VPSSQPSEGPSKQPTETVGTWSSITYDDFEDGWGNFQGTPEGEASKDARRQRNGGSQAPFIPQGQYALRIRDDAGRDSAVFHEQSYDVTAYSSLQVKFSYTARSMENNEGFFLEYSVDGGTNWITVKRYESDEDFIIDDSSPNVYTETVALNGTSVSWDGSNWVYNSDTFNPITTQAMIGFRCDASGNGDYVYIDEVAFEGFAP